MRLLAKIMGLPTAVLRIGGIAAVVAGLFGWFAFEQRKIGSQKAIKKVEIANARAVGNADKSGRGTHDPNARGMRDPYVRPPD